MTARAARTVLVVLVLSIATMTPVRSAQTPAGRSGTNRAPTASGIIRGRITAADTGRPLRRAQVTVTAAEIGMPRRTDTSLDGRYEFRDLPAGRYSVSVTRSGYLSLRYGQRRPMEQARPLQLGDAQTLDDINLALPRMGVIAGRVLDRSAIRAWCWSTPASRRLRTTSSRPTRR
ncbi:MAG: carboxypeptidase regulatory-like domain-containing protein [Acidobacteria bacterium]|nr:carboxypeptidase regulatory-like domain-containing protein [Acidobacteriota bacterium]